MKLTRRKFIKSGALFVPALFIPQWSHSHSFNNPSARRFARNKVRNGLVGEWNFDADTTIWTSDTVGTVKDSSGNGNIGTLTNMSRTFSSVQGKVGQGMRFDGTDDYVDAGIVSSLSLTGIMTATGWFKPDVLDGTARYFAGCSSAAGDQIPWSIYITTLSKIGFAHYGDGGGGTYVSVGNTTLQVGVWTHFAVVRTGTSGSWPVTIYFNGVPDGSTTLDQNPYTGGARPVAIGRLGAFPSNFFSGAVDAVRVYNRALSQYEISQLAGQ